MGIVIWLYYITVWKNAWVQLINSSSQWWLQKPQLTAGVFSNHIQGVVIAKGTKTRCSHHLHFRWILYPSMWPSTKSESSPSSFGSIVRVWDRVRQELLTLLRSLTLSLCFDEPRWSQPISEALISEMAHMLQAEQQMLCTSQAQVCEGCCFEEQLPTCIAVVVTARVRSALASCLLTVLPVLDALDMTLSHFHLIHKVLLPHVLMWGFQWTPAGCVELCLPHAAAAVAAGLLLLPSPFLCVTPAFEFAFPVSPLH